MYFTGEGYSGKSDRGGQGLSGLDSDEASGLAWNIATQAVLLKRDTSSSLQCHEVIIKTFMWLKGQYFPI